MPIRFEDKLGKIRNRRACVALDLLSLQSGDLFIIGDPSGSVFTNSLDSLIPDGVEVVHLDLSETLSPSASQASRYGNENPSRLLQTKSEFIPINPSDEQFEAHLDHLYTRSKARRVKCYFDTTPITIEPNSRPKKEEKAYRTLLEALMKWYEQGHPGSVRFQEDWGSLFMCLFASEFVCNDGAYVVEVNDTLLSPSSSVRARDTLVRGEYIDKVSYSLSGAPSSKRTPRKITSTMLYGCSCPERTSIEFLISPTLLDDSNDALKPFDSDIGIKAAPQISYQREAIPRNALLRNETDLSLNGIRAQLMRKGYRLRLADIAEHVMTVQRRGGFFESEALSSLPSLISSSNFDSDGELVLSDEEKAATEQPSLAYAGEALLRPYDILIGRLCFPGRKPSVNMLSENAPGGLYASPNVYAIRLKSHSPITARALYYYLKEGHGSELLSLIGNQEKHSIRWSEIGEIEVPDILDQSSESIQILEEEYGQLDESIRKAELALTEAKERKAALDKQNAELLEDLLDSDPLDQE